MSERSFSLLLQQKQVVCTVWHRKVISPWNPEYICLLHVLYLVILIENLCFPRDYNCLYPIIYYPLHSYLIVFSFCLFASAVFLFNLFLSINPNSDFFGILASSPTPFLIWFLLCWELPMQGQTMKKSYQFLKHLLCTTLNTVELKCKLWTHYCSPETLG